jgi:hypothetical protein
MRLFVGSESLDRAQERRQRPWSPPFVEDVLPAAVPGSTLVRCAALESLIEGVSDATFHGYPIVACARMQYSANVAPY